MDQVKTALHERQEQSDAYEALDQIIPPFKRELAFLVVDFVAQPTMTKPEVLHTYDKFNAFLTPSPLLRELSTSLTGVIPLDEGEMTVVIKSSEYPDIEHPETFEHQRFTVDVVESDQILILDMVSRIESKQRVINPGTNRFDTRRTQPLWEKIPTAQDLDNYRDILKLLGGEHVRIHGITPPKIVYITDSTGLTVDATTYDGSNGYMM